MRARRARSTVPFGLVLLESLPLGVVANHSDVDVTAEVQLLRPEERHGDWVTGWMVRRNEHADLAGDLMGFARFAGVLALVTGLLYGV